jgi:hypothetical protein
VIRYTMLNDFSPCRQCEAVTYTAFCDSKRLATIDAETIKRTVFTKTAKCDRSFTTIQDYFQFVNASSLKS